MFEVVGLLQLLVLGLVIAIVVMTGFTAWMLTHPPRRTYASAVARNRAGDPGELGPDWGGSRKFTTWKFEHDGLKFPVWGVVGDWSGNVNAPIVVLSHGWGDSRVGALSRLEPFTAIAARIVLWDMRGHGEAGGTCSLGTREVDDLLALIAHLREPDANRPIVLYGWSLGAGVSIAAAARLGSAASRVRCVIAEAPYRVPQTPAARVHAILGLPWRINLPLAFSCINLGLRGRLSPDKFDRAMHAEWLAKARVPLLVIHGEHDEVCPIQDGRDIALAGDGKMIEVESARHHGLWTENPTRGRLVEAIRGWVSEVSPRQVP